MASPSTPNDGPINAEQAIRMIKDGIDSVDYATQALEDIVTKSQLVARAISRPMHLIDRLTDPLVPTEREALFRNDVRRITTSALIHMSQQRYDVATALITLLKEMTDDPR